MIRILAVALGAVFLGLVTPAWSADADTDPNNLSIEAGRLGVMMGQSADALKRLAPALKNDDLGEADALRSHTFQDLVGAVLRYNLVSFQACRRGVLNGDLCQGPFLPKWLSEPTGTMHTDADIAAMVDETTGRLMPFWDAMCARAIKSGADKDFCAIE
ncbi:MAG: hypothetical protein GC166_10785 [Alphaproteobacteria bacterium]|nr:hypothetical protein [Alphaproteobacteria bacterium]